MKAQEFWEKHGKNIRGITIRKMRNAMRKHEVKDSRGEVIEWCGSYLNVKDIREFSITGGGK